MVPPPTLLQTANDPTKGPAAATQHSRKVYPLAIEDVCAAQHGIQTIAAYPKVFDLLNTDTISEAKDLLKNLTLLALEELPSLVVGVDGPPCHVQVILGI